MWVDTERNIGRRCRRGLARGLLLLALACLALRCSDPAVEESRQRLSDARIALQDGNASQALHLARSGLAELGIDAEMLLVAASACLELERFADAADYAQRGLALEGLAPADLADLNWAAGKAHLGLYIELRDDADWRAANGALERATGDAGRQRADAAYALVRMQGLGGMGSDLRRDKFGRLFLQLEPQGGRADKVRELLASGSAGGDAGAGR